MEFNNLGWTSVVLIVLLHAGIASASITSFISDGVLDSSRGTSRSLLQAKKNCPLQFEFMNYTIITSQCKAPNYPVKPCCDGFLRFACQYLEYINDLDNDCSQLMYNYIDTYGNYPPGLFSNECPGDKNGLPCPANYTTSSVSETNETASAAQVAHGPLLAHFDVAGFMMLSFLLLVIV